MSSWLVGLKRQGSRVVRVVSSRLLVIQLSQFLVNKIKKEGI